MSSPGGPIFKRRIWAELLTHALTLVAAAALAVAYTYPLIRHFSTHFVGTLGESINNVWNMWYFRYAVAILHTNPLWTDLLYWPCGANLILPHYTLLNDVLMYFLAPQVGLAVGHNLLYLASLTLSVYGVFLLLTDWACDPDIAFVAGTAFAFSPIMAQQMDIGRGQEYTSFHPVPFFVWTLSRVVRDEKIADVVLAALALTWVWSFNYYYFLSCMVLIPVFYAALSRPLRPSLSRRDDAGWLRVVRRAADGAVLAALCWVFFSLRGGQTEFHGRGSFLDLFVYVSPYLSVWVLIAVGIMLRYRVGVSCNRASFAVGAWVPYVGVLACWLAMNFPMIAATISCMLSGDYGVPASRWRGGGNPLDIVCLLTPNPFNPLWKNGLRAMAAVLPFRNQARLSGFGLLTTLGALWAVWRRTGDRWQTAWIWAFAAFAVLALGPWLQIFSLHTYLPLPFYFLHLLPVFSNMPTGDYFLVMASFFAALLFGSGLASVKAAATLTRRRWVAPLALMALVFELNHYPAKLFTIKMPAIIHRLRERPDGAVFMVPAHVHFHQLSFYVIGREFWFDDLAAQIIHQKPIMGGLLGRVSRRTYEIYGQDAVFRAVIAAQSGGEVAPLIQDVSAMRRYLSQMRLRYVLVNEAFVPPALEKALERWPMRLIDRDGSFRLFETSF